MYFLKWDPVLEIQSTNEHGSGCETIGRTISAAFRDLRDRLTNRFQWAATHLLKPAQRQRHSARRIGRQAFLTAPVPRGLSLTIWQTNGLF